ncbi:hypothetical protein AGMMS49942_02210 [Spirochaetia bacterium]|nr:hypothetical protein AGMMS49942_02210 [Spirochaetia bacterium]
MSQEALAERCGASTNHIAQIELGRHFASIEMIERIAGALKVEPYRLFKDESDAEGDEGRETRDFLSGLPDRVRRKLKKQLLEAIGADIDQTLQP